MSSDRTEHDTMLDERHETPRGMEEHELRQGPDFTQGAGMFTGQDEQFAYKRARSRLWEMCGSRWWKARMSDPAEWWLPVHNEGRFWEKKHNQELRAAAEEIVEKQGMPDMTAAVDGTHDGGKRRIDANLSDSVQSAKDASLFRHGASPFRTTTEPPPKFGWQHAWGMVTWGKKAGEWGKGVEGQRKTDREQKQDEHDKQ